jgi:hypothetical protein
MYPMRVFTQKSAKGDVYSDVFNHGVHEGVVSLINKIRNKHPDIDPNHTYHLYPQEPTSGTDAAKPSSKALPENDITFLEDCGVEQTDLLFYQP